MSFSPVIDDALLEPPMLQSFLGSDAVLRVIDKDAPKEIQELSVELGVGKYEFLPIVNLNPSGRLEPPLTSKLFIALTYFREGLDVKWLG